MLFVHRSSDVNDFFFWLLHDRFLVVGGSHTSITMQTQIQRTDSPNLRPAFNEIISALIVLYETAVCFLQVHPMSRNVKSKVLKWTESAL